MEQRTPWYAAFSSAIAIILLVFTCLNFYNSLQDRARIDELTKGITAYNKLVADQCKPKDIEVFRKELQTVKNKYHILENS